jgi:hypothetical protein
MNAIIQNILMFSALGLAIWFLVWKFFLPKKLKAVMLVEVAIVGVINTIPAPHPGSSL